MKTNKSNGQLTAQISMGDHKKSGFDLSNNVYGTGKIGRIIPTRALHVMPGDTIKGDSKVAVQFEPLAVPILANMDVKQEHFYVPYNVVWKNWDKFISGGEKLDYNGVAPNVSLSRIYEVVFAILNSAYVTSYQSMGNNNKGFILTSSKDVYNSLKRTIEDVGYTYAIKDILQQQMEALQLLNDLPELPNEITDDELQQYYYFKVINREDIDDNYEAIYEELGINGTKVIDELNLFIQNYIANNNGQFVLPTSLGLQLLTVMYDYIKSFIGIGSNIDYLNMGRLTYTEYVACMIQKLTTYVIQDWQFSEDVKLAIDSNFISNEPLTIFNLRANYNIWYNNYRDILLETEASEPVDSDEITDTELFTLLVPRQRCWEKDAFTTALDNPGTGNIGVPLLTAMGNNGPGSITREYLIEKYNNIGANKYGVDVINEDGSNICTVSIDGDKSWKIPTSFLSGVNNIEISDSPVNVAGFSLYALEAAQRAQKWLQKALFFGNRISDFYYMRFGVRFLDARLRLPELLTSSSELVKLDVVMNNTNITTEANGEVFRSIAGDRAAYASAYDNGNSFDRFCEEHGVIMSYLTIMPQVTYSYGRNRDYSRLDQFDYAFSEFATLGMDAVYSTEITTTSIDLSYNASDEDFVPQKIFGYQGRYYDYKAKHSEEHGELLDSQDMYTFARKFNMLNPNGYPKLNYEFVHCFPDLDMFVVDSKLADYFRYDIRHSTAAERELPSQSIYI